MLFSSVTPRAALVGKGPAGLGPGGRPSLDRVVVGLKSRTDGRCLERGQIRGDTALLSRERPNNGIRGRLPSNACGLARETQTPPAIDHGEEKFLKGTSLSSQVFIA